MLRTLLVTLALLAPSSLAATRTGQVATSVTRAFNLDQLEDRPGILELNYNFVTVVDFESQILQIDSGNPALFELSVPETNKNRVTLRARQASGRTDLVVTTADNRQAFFTLNVVSNKTGVGTLRYVVRSPVPRTELGNASGADELVGTPGDPVDPPAPSTAPPSTQTLASRLPTARTTPATRTSTPTPAAQRGLFDLTTQSSFNLRGEVVINYALNNLSDQTLRLERADLSLSQQGEAVPFTFSPSGRITLGPKRSVYGRITLQKAPTGPITLRWKASAERGTAELEQVLDLTSLLGR